MSFSFVQYIYKHTEHIFPNLYQILTHSDWR